MENRAVRRRRSAFAAFLATLVMALGFTAVPADAAPQEQVDYVALGDSYTAGTGAGEPLRPPNVDCWQSQPGYVDLVGASGRIKLAANGACHGAVLSRLSPTYDPVIYTPTVQEQIRSLVARRDLSRRTELVSMTAGANDLGFARVLGVCAFSDEATCSAAVTAATSPKALGFLTASLIQTYGTIQVIAPNARIAVLGYPLLFAPSSPFAPIPPANQAAMNQATLAVNGTIAQAVRKVDALPLTDIKFVDVTSEFAGHAVNTAEPWLQLDPNNFAADYNFHPNKEGHRAYASALLEAVKPAQLVR
ncbi:SGNH/GDSL hydrolase family protein [Pseudarthrobacter sp. B4EP4b]|uniref:SGNH/GDSL hydrolase family protein n=1 Tax=Pseudarthrobacter sp. B4EP4b TaxID=2590664 RepID=UPI0011501595|nr:SGNH/GDSL hydrolase family protein [Pseudarthrobacter sp. B4EP4b]